MLVNGVNAPLVGHAALTSGGIYRLSPKFAPGQALDVAAAGTANGANVQIWRYVGNANQKWRANFINGRWEFAPQHTGATDNRLDVRNGSSLNGENVWTWDANGGLAQRWQSFYNGDFTYSLQPDCAFGKRLDVSNGSPNDGTNVWIWNNNGGDAQRWMFLNP
jgi:endoglucanase